MTTATRTPGRLRANVNPDVVMMLCTAGHVDHGKTSLVKLLTGCNTDRLKAEQERGLTIELGFAPCLLGGECCVGIVDVPGHEKFVKNMVAGVSGIGMCVLVIAADDGIMPQTVEHLQIMELLGVRQGIVALTKIDRIPPAQIKDRIAAIRAFLFGTFLEGAPICPLSSQTGDGLAEFYEVLVGKVRAIERVPSTGVFRMPIERTFLQRGFGAVVTGIPVSGSIRLGDPVELVPGGQRGHVRGIQCFLRQTESGGAGQCLALNIPELGKSAPERGQVVCVPGCLESFQCFHVKVRAVAGLREPLKHAMEVKFHTGTSETPAKLYLIDQETLEPADSAYATLVATHGVAIAAGDQFLLRSPSPAATLAGGTVVAPVPDGKRPRKRDALALVALHAAVFGEGLESPVGHAEKSILFYLRTKGKFGAALAEIARSTLLTEMEAQTALEAIEASGQAVRLSGGLFAHPSSIELAVQLVESRLRQRCADVKTLSVSRTELLQGLGWPDGLAEHVLNALAQRGVVRLRGERILLQGAESGLGTVDAALAERMASLYEEKAFDSPRPEELPERLGAAPQHVERILKYLCDEGTLFRLGKNVVLARSALKNAQELAVKIITAEGVLDSADFKHHIRSTRKYALAVLDFLDARRVTVRQGNNRKLAANYQERLL